MNPVLLLSTASPGELFSELVPWLLVLLGVAVVGGVAVALMRRATRDAPGGTGEDFTLQGLRDLHAQGLLSDEEFERAKQAMIERIRSATSENADDGVAGNPRDSAS